MKKVLLILIANILIIPSVLAASCSYVEQAEYNKIAAKVLPQYEIVSETLDTDSLLQPSLVTDDVLYLVIYNISPEIYLKISNDMLDDAIIQDLIVRYSDTNDGVFKMRWDYKDRIAKFTIDIYSSEQTNCPNEKLTVKTFIMPKENEYYHQSICDGIKHKYCEQFIDFEEPSESTMINALKDEETVIDDDVNKDGEKANTLNNLKLPIIIGASSILIIGTILIIVIKKKNRRVKNEEL